MHGRGKSDSLVVPGKPPNNATELAAEAVEGRGLAKGNLEGCDRDRTLCRGALQQALDRVRQAARRMHPHTVQRLCVTTCGRSSVR